ncbi:hypothetical protein ABPG72_017634 [Tetrahymena utriculariae]
MSQQYYLSEIINNCIVDASDKRFITTNEQEELEDKFYTQLCDRQSQRNQGINLLEIIEQLQKNKTKIIFQDLQSYTIQNFLIEGGEGILFKALINQNSNNVIIKFIKQKQEDFDLQLGIQMSQKNLNILQN